MIFKFLTAKHKDSFGGNEQTALVPRNKLIAFMADEISRYDKEDKNVGAIILRIFSLKQIGNTHGFQQSDLFLANTVNSIKAILKNTDSIHRINEDELVIILPGLMNEGHLVLAANRIKSLFDTPVLIGSIPLSVKVAMGAALYPELSDDADELLLKSSIALEECIEKGLPYNVYPRDEATSLKSYQNIESQFRDAIESNALEVHYHPKIDIQTRVLTGAEAQARWNHPVHGLLPSNYLLVIAQKANLVKEFTNTLLTIILKEARVWRGIGADIGVSINLFSTNLLDDILIENIQRAINLWDMAPDKIVFEIPERAIMENPEASLLALKNIRSIGARCSIDNFGAGASALALLKKLPVSELKIDPSFISNILLDEGDKVLVDSIIHLAHNFHLQVVAEGVENEGTYKLLEQMSCDIAQGSYIAKPMPNTQFKQWLKETTWIINPL